MRRQTEERLSGTGLVGFLNRSFSMSEIYLINTGGLFQSILSTAIIGQ